MEMTGTFELDKPILLASVISFAFSRKFGLNIYDSGEEGNKRGGLALVLLSLLYCTVLYSIVLF